LPKDSVLDPVVHRVHIERAINTLEILYHREMPSHIREFISQSHVLFKYKSSRSDGFVSSTGLWRDLRQVMSKKEADRVLKEMSIDSNGLIKYDNFVTNFIDKGATRLFSSIATE